MSNMSSLNTLTLVKGNKMKVLIMDIFNTPEMEAKISHIKSLKKLHQVTITKKCHLNQNSCGESYFAVIFNCMFYLCLSPFKVFEDQLTGKYIIKSYKFHKVICGILHFNTFLVYINDYMSNQSSFDLTTTDIPKVINSVGYIASVMCLLSTVKLLWLDQDKLLKFIQGSRISPSSSRLIVPQKWFKFLMASLCLALQIGQMCLTETSAPINIMADTAISWLNFEDAASNKLAEFVHKFIEITLTLGSSLFSISRLIVILLSCNFKIFGDEFENFMEHNESVEKIVKRVDHLRSVVELGSGLANNLVLCLYVGLLSYLACIPALQFEKTRLVKRWYLVASYSIFGIFLLIACDLPARVNRSLRKWVARKRLDDTLSQKERFLIVSLSQEIDMNPIGLSTKFFTLTFSFVGSMIGLVTTYGILVLQMQQK